MKSFLNQFDIWLGRVATVVMQPLLYIYLFLLTFFVLFLVGFGIFEYQAGIADIDRLEFLLLCSLLFVSYRLFYRGREQKWSYWRLFKRYCFVSSTVMLLNMLVFSTIVLIALVEKGKVLASVFYQYQDAQYFISGVVLVLALYAAAPLPPFLKRKFVEEDSAEEALEAQTETRSDETTSAKTDPWTGQPADSDEQSYKGV